MSTQRTQSSAAFKARVALAALKGLQTVHALASPSGGHPTPIAHGKPRLQQEMPESFSVRRATRDQDQEALQAPLYPQSGPRTVALDGLKKTAGLVS
jgi:hypothetical protein